MRQDSREQQIMRAGGFTLVESVVTLAILAIVMMAVAGILSSGVRIMHQEEAISKADQLGEMVRVSIADDLRYASDVKVIDEGNIQFIIPSAAGTGKGTNGNLPAGTYTVSNGSDGLVYISAVAAGKDTDATSGPLLPSKSFIDDAKVTCRFAMSDDMVSVEVSVEIDDVQRSASSLVRPLNIGERP